MQNKSCLICHVLFASVSLIETPFLTKCCNRWICDNCLEQNQRFYTYCPFCQEITFTYNKRNDNISNNTLPTYEEVIYNDLNELNNSLKLNSVNEKLNKKLDEKSNYGAIHYVKKDDTLIGLAFKYGIEIVDIRKANRLFDDNIIARSTLIIPNYVGPSLSEKLSEEEEKKMLVKRFQIQSKCIDPIEARFYMEQSNYNIENATQLYRDDILWEMQHPIKEKSKLVKSKRNKSKVG
ncbi:Carbohydrate-Binding Module Family 50 protein [Glomus cerebriforme]|uniref:Carbohydrate-Binding Module Family 50 protein n=1 Tax=Glomus cerebriforme TaxID=658196 RepID=A0A397SMH0_9GLOM|nr:Carbohydrate-Binding Module Family 50 protein [Glomus cerebriforme]